MSSRIVAIPFRRLCVALFVLYKTDIGVYRSGFLIVNLSVSSIASNYLPISSFNNTAMALATSEHDDQMCLSPRSSCTCPGREIHEFEDVIVAPYRGSLCVALCSTSQV